MAIKILIDSASDMSVAEAKELGVEFMPMEIKFGEEEFLDGISLYPEEFYKRLKNSKVLPKTSQINPFRWEEKLDELTKDGSEVIVICLSSKISGTYESLNSIYEKYEGKVHIFDSLTVAIGERLLCYYALDLIKQGLNAKEVVSALQQVVPKLHVMAVVDTLEYLKKGGRISSTVALAGTLLSIKPVVAIVDGEVKMLGKAMGLKKANRLMSDIVKQNNGINLDMPFGTIWAGDDENLQKYVSDNACLWEGREMKSYIIGCTIGTHVGPGCAGIAFFEKDL